MTMPLLSLLTPGDAGKALAERMKTLRLRTAWTRETMAARAGVTSASLKRFETSGAASLDLVLRLAFALGRLEDFTQVCRVSEAASMAELRLIHERPQRKRGRS